MSSPASPASTPDRGLRERARASFEKLGIPTRKHEAWKYTHIEKALRHDYDLLEPIATRRVLRRHHVEDYVHDLRQLVLDFYATDSSPRPALGYVGFDLIKGRDDLIDNMLDSGKFAWVDQKDWLFTHSGMRIPSEELFDEVYRKRIMQQHLLANSAFGRY